MVGLLSVSAFAADTDLSRVLKAVETRYNSANSLQVLFHEEYSRPGRPRTSEGGTLTLSKPGRMRWEYTQPKGNLYISDGKQISMYVADENRVEISPIRESDDLHTPLAFLLGKLHFEKEFHNLQSRQEAGGALRITAEPKSDSLSYSQVEFVVSAKSEIQEVKVTGFDKSLMVYHFEQEKMNPPVDPKSFQFKPPAGAEVVEKRQ